MRVLRTVTLVLGLFLTTGRGANVEFNLNDFQVEGSLASRPVYLTPLSSPLAVGSTTHLGERREYTTSTSGTLTVSNSATAIYKVEVFGEFRTHVFAILVPDTNATVVASELIVCASCVLPGWANALYVRKTNSWSTGQVLTNATFRGSTNVFTHTNGSAGYYLKTDGTYAYWAEVVGAGGGSATNAITQVNGTTNAQQWLATGATGTDFNITTNGAGANATNTFNLPIASLTVTGKLAATDFATFSAKQTGSASLTNLSNTRAITNVVSSFGVLASDILYPAATVTLTNLFVSGWERHMGNVTNEGPVFMNSSLVGDSGSFGSSLTVLGSTFLAGTLGVNGQTHFTNAITYPKGTNTDTHLSATNYFYRELPSVPTPPAGYVAFYAKSDGHIYQKDSGGTEIDLTLGSGGGEANTLGNGGTTNAVRHPLAGGKSGVVLLAPTLQNGNGISIAGEYNGSGLPTNLVVSVSNTLNGLYLVDPTVNRTWVTNSLHRGWTNLAGASPVDLVVDGPGHAWLYMTNDTTVRAVPPTAGTLPVEMLLEVVVTNATTPYALTLSNFFGVPSNEQVLVAATNNFFRVVWTKTNVFIGSWQGRQVVVDAAVGAAGNGDTTNTYSKDDIHDYVFQNDSNFDGKPSAVEASSITPAMMAGFTMAQLNTLISDTDAVDLLSNQTITGVKGIGTLNVATNVTADRVTVTNWAKVNTLTNDGHLRQVSWAKFDEKVTNAAPTRFEAGVTNTSTLRNEGAVTLTSTLNVTGTASFGEVTHSADESFTGGATAVFLANSTEGSGITLTEDTDNGSHTLRLKSTNSLGGNRTINLPDADGLVALVGGDIGAATATTASAGDNGTSVATTAYVQTALTNYYDYVWVPAGALTPAAVNGASTNTYAPTGADGATVDVFDFDDTTVETNFCTWAPPDNWDRGPVKVKPYWTSTTGTGTVAWGFRFGAISNDDAFGAILGTQQTSTDTRLADNDMHVGPATAAITAGGTPALEDMLLIQVTRETGSDTKTGDAKLIGFMIQYRRSTLNSAAW